MRVLALRHSNPGRTMFMRRWLADADKQTARDLKHEWVPYEEVSIDLVSAVVVAEDSSFVAHHGFDWGSIRSAIKHNMSGNRPLVGASTITQQLAKNLYLSGRQSIFRKVQEAIITAVIELVLPKRRILELYLNVVEWGVGIFGIGAAARQYFGVAPSELRGKEAALLAAILPDPRSQNLTASNLSTERTRRIEERMARARIP